MKKHLFTSFLVLSLFTNLFANPGDTVIVQTFTNGSPQDAWFMFPSDTMRCQKVLMQYKLKCNPAQSPACGEWDYLTYTYLYDHTGLLDSTLVHQPVYTVNGSSPSSVAYMNSPSYSYSPSWQYFMVNTSTTSLNTYSINPVNIDNNAPFGTSQPVSHSQYLWKASEINASGMSAGNITGLQFYVNMIGSQLHNLKIRIKTTTLDSLSQTTYSDSVFTSVYSQNTMFASMGWNSLQFINPFNWNGTSNLLIDITYDNTNAGTDNILASSPTAYSSGLVNAGADRVASFHSSGYIEVPINSSIAAIDTAVTIAFWAFGSSTLQPMDGTCFEAVDSLDHRLLNAHLPWSDSNVYWDAGYSGTSYDRINKPATSAQIKGQWNYWTFTKNTITGLMKIYLNGNLWHSGTAKTKSMHGISKFKIGRGNWGGSQTYEGMIDEFAVFNSELSQSTIQAYMYKQIDAAHPNYSHLAAYYHFDDGNYSYAFDVAPGLHPMADLFSVNNPLRQADEISTNFTQSTLRPNITFEQGVYVQHLDSIQVIDSTVNNPITIITYTDSVNNPGVAIDTMIVWNSYYNNYTYNSSGQAVDSTLVTPDSTITQTYYDWFRKFPQVIRYELARYITPYGNNLSLGSGWTWTFDVSDYRSLLHDSIHLSAGNWQELLDVKFLFIKGIPPRDPISVTNLWNGGFNYGNASDPIDNYLQSKNIFIPSSAINTRWKSRITGHGMDTPENCAEFCAKSHYFKVNGVQQFSKSVWRDNCSLNPLYPQGGTWVYARANWCPGAEVWTYDWELTSHVSPGSTSSLDHDVQPYTHTGGWDYFQIEDQLVTYSAPNFTLDAALDEIISPSKTQMWARMNTVCTSPIVRIRNTGATPLTSLDITYGLSGAAQSIYHWTGNLKIDETALVTLGTFAWAIGTPDFNASVSNPNFGADQYPYNNQKTTNYVYPAVMPSQFVIYLKTNLNAFENQGTLKDDAGNIVWSRNSMTANTLYKDTLTLANGCYTFELTDSGEDGLYFWANTAQGSGYLQFHKLNPTAPVIKNFGADFGGKVYMQFTVGLTNNVNEYIFTKESELNVYPNPSDGKVRIDINLNERKDGKIEIVDVMGKNVYNYEFKNLTAESIDADLSVLKKGVYFVTFRSGSEFITKKLLME